METNLVEANIRMSDDEMWSEYSHTKSDDLYWKLVDSYMPVVKYVAGIMQITLPRSIQFDDLVSAGIIGLIQAVKRFDLSQGVKFETYCIPRIRGAILDELRQLDWIPRSVRSKAKVINKAIEVLESESDKPVTNLDIANKIGVKIEELHKMQYQISGSMQPLENIYLAEGDEYSLISFLHAEAEDPMARIEKLEFSNELARLIDSLPENQRLVLSFYYTENLTLKEISYVLNVSESRVSQLHTKAISYLQNKFKISKIEKLKKVKIAS
jgi:RNA polymerase sigma factor FliA